MQEFCRECLDADRAYQRKIGELEAEVKLLRQGAKVDAYALCVKQNLIKVLTAEVDTLRQQIEGLGEVKRAD